VVGTVADPAANFEANALGTFRVLGYSPAVRTEDGIPRRRRWVAHNAT
jgi:hypothetical protein